MARKPVTLARGKKPPPPPELDDDLDDSLDDEFEDVEEQDEDKGKAKGKAKGKQPAPEPSPGGGPKVAVGTLVHYHPPQNDPGPYPGDDEPLAATVASVLGENCCNLMVIGADGTPYARTGVLFCKKGEQTFGQPYCELPGQQAQPAGDDDPRPKRRDKARELVAQLSAFEERLASARKRWETNKQAKAEAKAGAKG
jgi:hypothetical protein